MDGEAKRGFLGLMMAAGAVVSGNTPELIPIHDPVVISVFGWVSFAAFLVGTAYTVAHEPINNWLRARRHRTPVRV